MHEEGMFTFFHYMLHTEGEGRDQLYGGTKIITVHHSLPVFCHSALNTDYHTAGRQLVLSCCLLFFFLFNWLASLSVPAEFA